MQGPQRIQMVMSFPEWLRKNVVRQGKQIGADLEGVARKKPLHVFVEIDLIRKGQKGGDA